MTVQKMTLFAVYNSDNVYNNVLAYIDDYCIISVWTNMHKTVNNYIVNFGKNRHTSRLMTEQYCTGNWQNQMQETHMMIKHIWYNIPV